MNSGYILKASQRDLLMDWIWDLGDRGVRDESKEFGKKGELLESFSWVDERGLDLDHIQNRTTTKAFIFHKINKKEDAAK